jgi:hypothetical protein
MYRTPTRAELLLDAEWLENRDTPKDPLRDVSTDIREKSWDVRDVTKDKYISPKEEKRKSLDKRKSIDRYGYFSLLMPYWL